MPSEINFFPADAPKDRPSAAYAEWVLEAQKRSLEMLVVGEPLTAVLEYLTTVAEEHSGNDAVASILLLDPKGLLQTGAAPSLPAEYNSAIDGLAPRVDLGTCAAAAARAEVIITPDIDADPQWAELKSLPLALGLKAAWSQPILSRDGTVLGTFGTYFRTRREPTSMERRLVETLASTAALAIERARADEALSRRARIIDMALEAASMGPWRYRLEDKVCTLSERAQALYGMSDAVFVRDEGAIRGLLHPDDAPAMEAALARATDPAGGGHYEVEYRTRRPDGGWRWLSVWGIAEFETDEHGHRRAVAVVGASRDISEQKEAERQRDLMAAELAHRVKNTLAIVQSIAAQTYRATADPSQFLDAFAGRIKALAGAHDMLTQAHWSGALMGDIAKAALAPFGLAAGLLRTDGPQVTLPAQSAVTLALMLHELATNAAKYGALSRPEGRVDIVWREAGGRLALTWTETGGPAVTPPSRLGFGSRLVAASAAQLGGERRLDYRPEGLTCTVVFPV